MNVSFFAIYLHFTQKKLIFALEKQCNNTHPWKMANI